MNEKESKWMLALLVLALLLSWVTSAEERGVYIRYTYVGDDGQIVTGHGSAFAVANDRLFTAAHNVLDDQGKARQTVTAQIGGSWIPARVLRFERELDIAILQVDARLTPLPLAPGDPHEGERVEFVGSMKGAPVAPYLGVVEKRWHGATARTLARVKFDHGLSGCPVLSEGKVVGVAVCGIPKDGDLDHEVGLFVPVSIIRWFIQQQRKD